MFQVAEMFLYEDVPDHGLDVKLKIGSNIKQCILWIGAMYGMGSNILWNFGRKDLSPNSVTVIFEMLRNYRNRRRGMEVGLGEL